MTASPGLHDALHGIGSRISDDMSERDVENIFLESGRMWDRDIRHTKFLLIDTPATTTETPRYRPY